VEARTDGVGESRGCAAREAAGGGADASRRRRGPRPPEGAIKVEEACAGTVGWEETMGPAEQS
jgi:hypothetical protein